MELPAFVIARAYSRKYWSDGNTQVGHTPFKDAMRCAATSGNGLPCRAIPMARSAFCFWHEPSQRGARRDASSRGGRSPRKGPALSAGLLRPTLLDDPMRLAGVLEGLIGSTLRGKVSVHKL